MKIGYLISNIYKKKILQVLLGDLINNSFYVSDEDKKLIAEFLCTFYILLCFLLLFCKTLMI